MTAQDVFAVFFIPHLYFLHVATAVILQAPENVLVRLQISAFDNDYFLTTCVDEGNRENSRKHYQCEEKDRQARSDEV
jgi:hypothetical protein